MSEYTVEEIRSEIAMLDMRNGTCRARGMLEAYAQHLEAAQEVQRGVEATAYAERIARSLWRKHYANDAPEWEAMKGDLMGLLSQIDNMLTGLARAKHLNSVQDVQINAENAKLRAKVVEWERRWAAGFKAWVLRYDGMNLGYEGDIPEAYEGPVRILVDKGRMEGE